MPKYARGKHPESHLPNISAESRGHLQSTGVAAHRPYHIERAPMRTDIEQWKRMGYSEHRTKQPAGTTPEQRIRAVVERWERQRGHYLALRRWQDRLRKPQLRDQFAAAAFSPEADARLKLGLRDA